MKPIERAEQLPEPDHDDETHGAPPDVEPEHGDIDSSGHLDDADEGR